MDRFFNGLDGRLRVSGMVADSLMMGIVNSAMEQAYKKVCSREGDLERLNEKSRFCELAIMQLEWCLKFIQEEMDSYLVESSCEREKLVLDLMEMRDRIQRRLEETELAIAKKDRELTERMRNEGKLRQALELQEEELSSLRSVIDLERVKSERVRDFVIGNRVSGDEDGDDDFCELKSALDHQFWSIKQQVENGRVNLNNGLQKMNRSSSNTVKLETELEMVEVGGCNSSDMNFSVKSEEVQNDGRVGFYKNDYSNENELLNCCIKTELKTAFEHMGSDIDILKEMLKLVFEMMDNAISLSKVGQLEQQWERNIERETIAVIFRGFLIDVQEKIEAKSLFEKKQVPLSLSGEDWAALINNIKSLRHELGLLVIQNEVQSKPPIGHEMETTASFSSQEDVRSKDVSASFSSQEDVRSKDFSRKNAWMREKPLLEHDLSGGASREGDHGGATVERCGKLSNASSNAEELDTLEDLSKEDGHTNHYVAEMIRNHESIIKKKTQEINLLKGEIFREKRQSSLRKNKDLDNARELDHDLYGGASREDDHGGAAVERCGKLSNTSSNAEELDTLLDLSKEDGHTNHSVAGMIRNHESIIKKKTQEINWLKGEISREKKRSSVRKNKDLNTAKRRINEVISRLDSFIEESDKLVATQHECRWADRKDKLVLQQNNLSPSKLADAEKDVAHMSVEVPEKLSNEWASYSIKENFSEEIKHLKQECEDINIQSMIMEETYSIFLKGLVKALHLELDNNDIEHLVRADIYTVMFREMVDEWNNDVDSYKIETFIREDIYRIVFSEVVRDIESIVNLSFTNFEEASNQNVILEDTSSTSNLFQSHDPTKRESLIKELGSLPSVFEVGEELMLNGSSEWMEQCSHLDLVGQELEELGEENIQHARMFIEEEDVFGLGITEKALQQRIMSKAQLKESEFSLGITVGGREEVHDQMTSLEGNIQDREHSLLSPTRNEEGQWNALNYIVAPLTEFSNGVTEFERNVQDKIGVNISRLEEVNRQLSPLVENVSALRKKELLYRKAFTRRCYDLQKAEAEVDLLGDEVDMLMCLIEKTYIALDHYSPVLQHYFGIMDILKLIRRELNGKAAPSS